MMIDFKSGLDAEEESRFSRELMRFPRASTRAKIVNLNPKMTQKSLVLAQRITSFLYILDIHPTIEPAEEASGIAL